MGAREMVVADARKRWRRLRFWAPIALATAGLIAPRFASAAPAAGEAAPPAMTCPQVPFWPVSKRARFPALITTLFPALKVIQEIGRDPLERARKRPVTVRVVDAAGQPVRGALVGFLRRDGDDLRFLAEAPAGKPVAVPLGDYVVNAAVADGAGNLRWGSGELAVGATGRAPATIRLSQEIPAVRPRPLAGETYQGAEVMLDVDGLWQPNATVDLVWRGPSPPHKTIDDDDADLAMPPLVRERPFPLTLPAKVGPYEARYMLCAPRLVLARWPVRVKRAEITLTAPERAKTATEIEVVVSGMLAAAQRLHLRDAAGNGVDAQPLVQGPTVRTRMRMPFAAGRYELVVTMPGERRPLARRTIEIEAAPIVIDYPDRVALGEVATLGWPLADAPETRMSLWSLPGPAKPASEVWPTMRPGAARLIAPPGDYELRLMHRKGLEAPRLLARKAVSVTGRAFADVPAQARAAEKLTIRLAIPGQFFDRVMFVRRGEDRATVLFDEIQPRGHSVVVPAPPTAGSYDLVYQMGEVGQRKIVERVPVEVR